MSTATRIFIVALASIVVLFTATIGVATASVLTSGSVAVNVSHDDGKQLSFSVPGSLAELALVLAPDDVWLEAGRELEPWLPAVRAVWGELSDAPDFVLVEVVGRHEHVRVEKRGRRLVVLVDEDDASIEVAIPLRAVGRLLRKLDTRLSISG